LRAAGDRNYLGAEHFHPINVGRLAVDVLGPHVDGAGQIEQRADGGGGHPVLTGAGFGDDPLLAHAPGQ